MGQGQGYYYDSPAWISWQPKISLQPKLVDSPGEMVDIGASIDLFAFGWAWLLDSDRGVPSDGKDPGLADWIGRVTDSLNTVWGERIKGSATFQQAVRTARYWNIM